MFFIIIKQIVKVSKEKKLYLVYLVTCAAKKKVIKLLTSKKFTLIYFIACAASIQVVNIPKEGKIYLIYLVIYKNKFCYKVLKGRKVYLINLIFFIAKS